MKIVEATRSEFAFNPASTSAAQWKVYPTVGEAKENAPNHAHCPGIWAWRDGYITAASGHPVPKSALLIARSSGWKWRWARDAQAED